MVLLHPLRLAVLRCERLEGRDVPAVIPGITVPESVTAGLVDADAVPDAIAVAGPGGSCRVVVLSGADGSVLLNTIAYDPEFRGGGQVAFVKAGTVAGEPEPPGSLLVAAGPGGGPHVLRFAFDGAAVREVASFFALPPDHRAGLAVGSGDADGDGRDDGLFLSPLGMLAAVDLDTLDVLSSVPVPPGLVAFDPAGGVLTFPGGRRGVVLEYADADPDPFRTPSVVVDPLTGAAV
jgi:hypothetical protein